MLREHERAERMYVCMYVCMYIRGRASECGRTRMCVARVVGSFKVRPVRHPREIRFYRSSLTVRDACTVIYRVSSTRKENFYGAAAARASC